MPFQLNAKNVFLTYPRCDVSKEALHEFLHQKFPTSNLCVGHELHEDGASHLHALVSNPTPIRLKGERAQSFFDYDGCHPNIQGARDPGAVLVYIRKYGDTIESGTFLEGKKDWAAILSDSTNRDEFISNIKQHHPRDYVLNLERIEYCANYHFKSKIPDYTPKSNFIYDFNDLDLWVDQMTEVSSFADGGGRTRPTPEVSSVAGVVSTDTYLNPVTPGHLPLPGAPKDGARVPERGAAPAPAHSTPSAFRRNDPSLSSWSGNQEPAKQPGHVVTDATCTLMDHSCSTSGTMKPCTLFSTTSKIGAGSSTTNNFWVPKRSLLSRINTERRGTFIGANHV